MTIEILSGTTWADITEHVLSDNCRLRFTFGNQEFKYAVDTFDFSILGLNRAMIRSFLANPEKIEVRVTSDPTMSDPMGVRIFHGDIRPGNNISISDNYGNLNLTAEDLCSRLRIPCPTLFYISGDLKQIAEDICTYAGLSFSFPAEMSNSIVRYFIREADDDNCLTLLDSLLWEFGWTLYAHPVDGISARTWWFRNTGTTVQTIDESRIVETLDINEEELDFDLLNVEWTIAGNQVRDVNSDASCESGLRLYLSTRENIAISADEYWPPEGLLTPRYFRYNARTADILTGGDADRGKIIYAYDQCLNFIEETGHTGHITAEVEDHGSLRSRIVFKNNDTVARTLVRFEVRGSAVYSQGTGTSTVGAFSESEDFSIVSVDRTNPAQIVFQLPSSASQSDNFYNGYRLVSANGTNVLIDAYAGDPFYRASVSDVEKVSPLDTAGTNVTLISPQQGIKEKKLTSRFLYNAQEGNNLAEAFKNASVYGRYSARFRMRQADSPPTIGQYARFKYDLYGIDVNTVVYSFEYTPDDADSPLVNIELKRIQEFSPERAYLRAASYTDPELPGEQEQGPPGPPGVGGIGFELIYAETDVASVSPNQRPLDNWGYQQPGAVGGLTWQVRRPSTS